MSDDFSPGQLQALMQQASVPDYKMGGYGSARNPATSPLAAMYANDPSTPEWQAKYGPLSGMNDLQKTEVGFGRGVVNAGRQLGNIAGLEPDSALQEAAELDAPLMSTGAGRFGSFAGETGALVPLTMGADIGLGATGLGARLLARPILRGAMEGAAQGGLMAGPGNRAAGALTGAATGGALPIAGRGINRLIQGATRTPEAQLLIDKGVPMTPGLMNPRGNANLISQSFDRVPLVGPLIRGADEAAKQGYQRAVIQEGAAPGTAIKQGGLNEMFDQAANSWDPVYAQVHGHPIKPEIFNEGANIPLSDALTSASQVPGLKPTQVRSINEWLQARLSGLPVDKQTGSPMVESYIGQDSLRSDIRQRIRDLGRSTDVDAPLIQKAYQNAESAVTQAIESQLPPDAAATLRNADAGYSQLKTIEDAVARSKDNVAGLTGSKLSDAVKQATPKAIYAKGGGGPLRDLARAGTSVFENVVPPTGARTPLALGALALASASPHAAIPTMGALGGGSLLLSTTDLGRRLAAGLTAPQRLGQGLLGSMMDNTTPFQRGLADLSARTALTRSRDAQATARALPGAALTIAAPWAKAF